MAAAFETANQETPDITGALIVGSYFKPLRRKLGMVTLLLACVSAGGWVRSLMVFDELSIPVNGVEYYLNSANGELGWWIDSDFIRIASTPISFRTRIGGANQFSLALVEIDWTIKRYGFGCGQSTVRKLQGWMIPYWSVVVPLTLLSAYLLLSQPVATKPISVSKLDS